MSVRPALYIKKQLLRFKCNITPCVIKNKKDILEIYQKLVDN